MREQRQRVEPLRLHHQHETAHPFFPTGAKRRHDFVITDARCKRVIGNLKFSGVNTEATQGPARPEATQSILKRYLKAECFDCHISAATGELFYFGNDIALSGIEHNVRAHSFRHFHSNGIAFHTDDQ